MKKVGILTFHYSNNYGGVIQAICLYKTIKSMGYEVEIIDFVPSDYKPLNIIKIFSINRNDIFNSIKLLRFTSIIKKMFIVIKNAKKITKEFDIFRQKYAKLSTKVNENNISEILNDYFTIIVGSDQVWNPSQRKKHIYFLDFGALYRGKKISYSADSTTSSIDSADFITIKNALMEFDYVSVRNNHSSEFVEKIIQRKPQVVLDPTLLVDLNIKSSYQNNEYILTYILGTEILGTHKSAINLVKKEIGNIPVYSIVIPTTNFSVPNYSDKVFYDLSPEQWIILIKNAKFVYTDSFHGVLFSLKYHVRFLAYYTEESRKTRFIDLSSRFCIDRFIVQNVDEILSKESLLYIPNFESIDHIIMQTVDDSLSFLRDALNFTKLSE